MLLSILVPTYNQSEKLLNLISFLKKQNFDSNEVEVLISNNCSSDDTKSILDDNDFYTAYNQNENIGMINNFLFLINKAKGRYIWIIGDDFLCESVCDHVLSILRKEVNYDHIFIKFGIKENDTFQDCKLNLSSNNNGMNFFENIVEQIGIGSLMFISANIYSRELVYEVNNILKLNNELDNYCLPLAYSLYAIKGFNYCIDTTLIYDDITETTWSEKKVLVYCRDMIAIFDIMTNSFENKRKILSFLDKNKCARFPDVKYFMYRRKFNKSNYALYFYRKYFKFKFIFCWIFSPVIILMFKIKKIISR